MSKIITPTVGRKVWYRPSKYDTSGIFGMQVQAPDDNPAGGQPLDATVIAVWGDRMVNLLVTDIAGKQFPVLSCTLLQPGDSPALGANDKPIGRYAEWMPYQVAAAPVVAEPLVPVAEPAAPGVL